MRTVSKAFRRVVIAAAMAGALIGATQMASASVGTTTSTATSKTTAIHNDSFWKDTSGNLVASQGGGVFKFGDTYYWYGVHYQEAAPYAASPTQIYKTSTFSSIDVYSSKDLVNWTFRNQIATRATKLSIPPSKDVVGDAFSRMTSLADAGWIGRLGVVYNEKTHKYVLVTQAETSFDTNAKTNHSVMFLESDSPTGNFTYANLQTQIPNVLYQGTGDQTVFTDDDGSDFLVFSNQSGRAHSYVAQIDPSDSLSIDPAVEVGYNSAGREGNAMFKANGHYYIASSDLHGWNSSATHVIESTGTDIKGPYSAEFVMPGSEADYSHVSQTGFFFTVHGSKGDTVVSAGDRWAEFAWNGLGYNQWEPLSFAGDVPQFNSLSAWNLDAKTGRWGAAKDNNYILNPQFEADRVAVTTITGWTASAAATPFVTNPSPGANGSRNAVTLGNPAGFTGSLSQEVKIPKGTYTLALSARTTAGLDQARVSITDAKGRVTQVDLKSVGTAWTPLSRPKIKLAAGTVTVSIEAASAATGTLSVDALSLKQS